MTRGVSVEGLLRRPVVLRGIRLGEPTDLVLDAATLRAVGIDVRCGDETHRFLPLPAARIGDDQIAVGSALMLMGEGDAAFYRRRACTFRSLLGLEVARDGSLVGELADLVIGEDGRVEALGVRANGSSTELALDRSVTIGGRSRDR